MCGAKPAGSRSVDDLASAGLDDDDVYPCHCKFSRQHHPGRALHR